MTGCERHHPGTTSYLYDAGGNLLIQQDPGSVTLFLPDVELVLNTATSTRYYTLDGQTVAARTDNQVQYLIPDREGTDQLAIDSQTARARRALDRFSSDE